MPISKHTPAAIGWPIMNRISNPKRINMYGDNFLSIDIIYSSFDRKHQALPSNLDQEAFEHSQQPNAHHNQN